MTKTDIINELNKIVKTTKSDYVRKHARTIISLADKMTFNGMFEGLVDAIKMETRP